MYSGTSSDKDGVPLQDKDVFPRFRLARRLGEAFLRNKLIHVKAEVRDDRHAIPDKILGVSHFNFRTRVLLDFLNQQNFLRPIMTIVMELAAQEPTVRSKLLI